MRSDTTPAGHRDLPVIWNATTARIAVLLAELTDMDGGRALPTVHGASIADCVAHMSSTLTTALDDPAKLYDGSFVLPAGGAAMAPLTGLITAWRAAIEVLEERVTSAPELTAYLITDAVMSEHDLRTALDIPGARDDIAIKVALDELAGRFSDRVDAAGLPPLRVTVEQWGTIAGARRAITCVVADRFEFVRAMSGRRAAAEIHRWNWGADPDAYIPVIAEVAIPTDEVRERDPRIPSHMRDREFVL